MTDALRTDHAARLDREDELTIREAAAFEQAVLEHARDLKYNFSRPARAGINDETDTSQLIPSVLRQALGHTPDPEDSMKLSFSYKNAPATLSDLIARRDTFVDTIISAVIWPNHKAVTEPEREKIGALFDLGVQAIEQGRGKGA